MFPVSVNGGCSNEIRSGNILDEEVEGKKKVEFSPLQALEAHRVVRG
jgi:hypothetical protein